MKETTAGAMVFGTVATVQPTITFSTFPGLRPERADHDDGDRPEVARRHLRLVE